MTFLLNNSVFILTGLLALVYLRNFVNLFVPISTKSADIGTAYTNYELSRKYAWKTSKYLKNS